MKHFIFVLLVIFMTGPTVFYAQSPYQFDWKKEGVLSIIGLSTFSGSLVLRQQTPTYDHSDIALLSRSRVNSFDRVATYNYSLEAGKMSDHLSLGSKLLPIVFLAPKDTRRNFHEILILYGETYLIANGLTTMTKTSVLRTRPFVYNENVDIEHKLDDSARYSFFSGHTSKTAAMTFFTAKIYNDYYPESKWRPFVWTAAAAVPAVTGYLRVKAGKHYPSDVMVGYAVGALSGILVPHLHKRVKKKIHNPILDNMRFQVGHSAAKVSLEF